MSESESYLVNPSVSHGTLNQDDDERERLPRPVLFMKFVELAFAIGCLGSYVRASTMEDNESKIGLSWATFGSQVIIMVFGLVGYIIGETTPRLTIGHNALGGILFAAAGACNIETWWDYQEVMFGTVTDSQTQWDAGMLLLTGIMGLMNAALLFSDTLVAAVLWRLSQVRGSW